MTTQRQMTTFLNSLAAVLDTAGDDTPDTLAAINSALVIGNARLAEVVAGLLEERPRGRSHQVRAYTLSEIAAALGVTRQAVHKRFVQGR